MNTREKQLLQEFERMHPAARAWSEVERKLWAARLGRLQKWLEEAKIIAGGAADWIGFYLKESAVFSGGGTDLILGPFIGAATDHIRIPLDRGICGLALREERVVNVRDVREDPRHIACSITTRSELVIPLADSSGRLIAELDVDSNKLNAFTSELEGLLRTKAGTFAQAWGALDLG